MIRRPLRAATRTIVLCLSSVGLVALVGGGDTGDGDASRASYSLGHQIGTDLARQGRTADLAALERGLRDGLAGRDPAFPRAELDALLLELKRGIVTADRADRIRGARTLREAGEAFLAENAERDGVVTLPSGLQYRVVRAGSGPRPGPGDRVRVRYRSTRLDGAAFHDSMAPDTEPEILPIDAMIPGLREAVPLMPTGARWEIFLPARLAFGRRGPLADHTVVYDLELIAVVPGEPSEEERERR